jgi:homopolymeric O-antigen transport system permease protein
MTLPSIIEPTRGLARPDLHALWQFRELLYFLVWRDVKVRYKQTALGAAWALCQPLMQMAVLTLVFGTFARLPSDGYPYAAFVYAGLIPWTYLATAVAAASTSVVAEQAMLTKVWFPRLLLPLASVVRPAVDFGLSLVAAVVLLGWYGIPPTPQLLELPAWLALAAATAIGLGLWLSALHVRFRDVQHVIPLLLQVWLFASPVAYPVTLVPERWRWLYALNPAAQVIEGMRGSLLDKPNPIIAYLPASLALVAVTLLAGALFFRSIERTFADVV